MCWDTGISVQHELSTLATAPLQPVVNHVGPEDPIKLIAQVRLWKEQVWHCYALH